MPKELTIPEKVLEHIEVSAAAMQKAAAERDVVRRKQAEVAAIIPQVCDALVQFERIQPNQREKLAQHLQDPVRVLQLMIKLAGHRNADELARLGTGVPADGHDKTASSRRQYNSLTSNYVGERHTRVKQSSVLLFQGLGLSAPSDD